MCYTSFHSLPVIKKLDVLCLPANLSFERSNVLGAERMLCTQMIPSSLPWIFVAGIHSRGLGMSSAWDSPLTIAGFSYPEIQGSSFISLLYVHLSYKEAGGCMTESEISKNTHKKRTWQNKLLGVFRFTSHRMKETDQKLQESNESRWEGGCVKLSDPEGLFLINTQGYF